MRGHGTYMEDDKLYASVAGVVERVNKLICVKPVKSRYSGDIVIDMSAVRYSGDLVIDMSAVRLNGGIVMDTFAVSGDIVIAEDQRLTRRSRSTAQLAHD
ncbi:hypothetical protein LSAT2_010817 [Lamellibrachia satsuma]|nr:hypothetical protein LSAT2_010817 [Lamellibrachia satsuma]